jgi:hypothetical protein
MVFNTIPFSSQNDGMVFTTTTDMTRTFAESVPTERKFFNLTNRICLLAKENIQLSNAYRTYDN